MRIFGFLLHVGIVPESIDIGWHMGRESNLADDWGTKRDLVQCVDFVFSGKKLPTSCFSPSNVLLVEAMRAIPSF
jgi:hypothetical protein